MFSQFLPLRWAVFTSKCLRVCAGKSDLKTDMAKSQHLGSVLEKGRSENVSVLPVSGTASGLWDRETSLLTKSLDTGHVACYLLALKKWPRGFEVNSAFWRIHHPFENPHLQGEFVPFDG